MLSKLLKCGLGAATLLALWASTPEAQAQRRSGWNGRGSSSGVNVGPSGAYVSPNYGYGNTRYGNYGYGNRWGGDRYWDSRYYGRPYGSNWYGNTYYSTPTNSYYPSTTYVPSSTYSESYYPPATTQTASTARVRVRVTDPNAEVFFNGSPTRQRGLDRVFDTPPLSANSHNSYEIRARFMGPNGQMTDTTRHVDVEPGREAFVDFTVAQ